MSFKHKELTMHKQQGFSLAELSVTTVITAMIIIGGIQMQAYQATQEAAQSIAQIYQRISKAADSYMANHYGLLRNLPDQCSNLPFAGSTMAAIPPGPPAAGCSITIPSALPGQNVVVANAFQPTLAELRQLGFLVDASGAQFVNQLPIQTFGAAAGNALRIVDANRNPAPNEFRVLIRRIALAGATADLQSLVFNLQPFNLTNSSRAGGVLLDLMVQAGGGDAFLSDSEGATNGRLRAQAGAAENSLANPLQVVFNDQVQGAPFVFAMRGGFGSSGYDQFVRRDGTQPLTADWNVGNHDITGIRTLGANTVNATNGTFVTLGAGSVNASNGTFGTLGAGTVNATNGTFGTLGADTVNATNGTFLTLGAGIVNAGTVKAGTVNAGTGVFAGLLSGVSATFSGALEAASAKINGLLEAASAKIAGTLEVLGNAVFGSLNVRGAATLDNSLTVAGVTALNGQTTAQQLRLGASAILGGACDPSRETVARFAEESSPTSPYKPKLLVCDPNTNTWTFAVNFSDAIDGLTGSVNTLSSSLVATNSNLDASVNAIKGDISTINTQIGGLDGRVTILEVGLKNVADNVTVLQSGVTNLNSSVSTLQSGVNNLQSGLASANLEVSGLKTDVTDLKKYRLKWDIINVQWDKASGYVWKRTPWSCDRIAGGTGGLPVWDAGTNVRYLQNASDNQLGRVYTPPIIVGLDNAPADDTVVYDVNCEGGAWYVGMSAVKANMTGGNACRSGLTIMDGSNCQTSSGITLSAKNYSSSVMSARFIAFTKVE